MNKFEFYNEISNMCRDIEIIADIIETLGIGLSNNSTDVKSEDMFWLLSEVLREKSNKAEKYSKKLFDYNAETDSL